jgi:hypothetical protein
MRIPAIISLLLLLSTGTVLAQNSQAKVVTPSNQTVQSRNTRFYPNPATSAINFEIPRSAGEVQGLRLFNFLGKKVLDLPRVSTNTRIDLTALGRGIYIFQVLDANGRVVESGKFSIEK